MLQDNGKRAGRLESVTEAKQQASVFDRASDTVVIVAEAEVIAYADYIVFVLHIGSQLESPVFLIEEIIAECVELAAVTLCLAPQTVCYIRTDLWHDVEVAAIDPVGNEYRYLQIIGS